MAGKGKISLKFEIEGERTPGLAMVEQLLADGKADPVELTPEVAEQALEAFESLEFPGLFSRIIESGEEFAKQVHSVATRGLQEVVQNADDQGASNIRFGFRRRADRSELLIAHDGEPVEIADVIWMTLPLLSGSREDPEKIGRFGIGLKTLNQLGDRLAVHCPPVPGFEIRRGRISRTKRAARPIKGFWDPDTRETLFIVSLGRDDFDWQFFKDWLATWDASSLLFLRTVRSVSLTDLSSSPRGKTLGCGLEIGQPRNVELPLPRAAKAQQVSIKEVNGRRRWTRYAVDYPRPRRLLATNKESGETVRLQVAVANQPGRSRIYVGLPLNEPSDLPYSLSAPFDPNVERTKVRDNNALNEWLIERIGDFATAITLKRFEDQPRGAWASVPLERETAGESPWVAERFKNMAARHRRLAAERVAPVLPDGAAVKLGELTFEHEGFERLITAEQVDRLWAQEWSDSHGERRAVPEDWRDKIGRWRVFLDELDGPEALTAGECLAILEWPDVDLPNDHRWLVEMAGAALQANAEDDLWEKRCVALAGDGGRQSPAEIDEQGALLVHLAPKRGDLAADLDLAQQIARPFKSRQEPASAVRQWLTSRGVLRERASDRDALVALARAKLDAPIDLRGRDSVLTRLRNSFERLPAEERLEIGSDLGRNIGLTGHRFENGEKVSILTRLSEAHLSSAIDKSVGWSTAAAQTPGLAWVDRRYSDVLRTTARGAGALGFLRALGAATGPRVVRAAPPTANPNATPLIRKRALNAQHRHELAPYPEATGLREDWLSPDLDMVIADLLRDKKSTQRRKRAEALFLTLDRAWIDVYEERAAATAVHHRYSWQIDGEVSATWIAKLASAPWLSTREPKFRPAAPRDLTVLTPAAYEIKGEDLSKYVSEIGEDRVDSPVVDALGIQGRPRAGAILDRLESFRDAEIAGNEIRQTWADSCYAALASYVPGEIYEDRSNLTDLQLKRAFAKTRTMTGLVRCGDRWLAPSEVRRGPPLGARFGWVTPTAESLWSFLGIEHPSAADCVAVLASAVKEPRPDARSTELLAFRRLLELEKEGKLGRNSLQKIPLRLHGGAVRDSRSSVYAVASPSIATALGEQWPTWDPPLPLAELGRLLPLLDVEVLDSKDFSAEIPGELAAASFDAQNDYVAANGHLQDYLAIHHPTLHKRLSPSQWGELRRAHVIIGPGWGIRVRAGRRRSTLLGVPAHIFHEPVRFCLWHESEIENPDTGGEAIAGFVVGAEEAPEERSTVALAWAYSYRVRDQIQEEISLVPPDTGAQDAPPTRSFEEFSGKRNRKPGKRRPSSKSNGSSASPRELVDFENLKLDQIRASFLEGRRRTRLKVPPNTKLAIRDRTNGDRLAVNAKRSSHSAYTPRDREDLAFEIVDAVLSADRHLELEDIRDQNRAGADAVDRGKDIWVELKAHGRDLPENLRFPRSEAARAEEKKGNYWLVVVWDLEKPRTPQFVVIPDPLHRLDTYIGHGLELTGLRELAANSSTTLATNAAA
jgi:hypothetical protein